MTVTSNVAPTPPEGALKKTAAFVKDWREIITAIIAIVAVGFAVWNYFITRDEFDRVNCQIRNLLELNSLELTEKKITDLHDQNVRELVRLDGRQIQEDDDKVNIQLRTSQKKSYEDQLTEFRRKILVVKANITDNLCPKSP